MEMDALHHALFRLIGHVLDNYMNYQYVLQFVKTARTMVLNVMQDKTSDAGMIVQPYILVINAQEGQIVRQ